MEARGMSKSLFGETASLPCSDPKRDFFFWAKGLSEIASQSSWFVEPKVKKSTLVLELTGGLNTPPQIDLYRRFDLRPMHLTRHTGKVEARCSLAGSLLMHGLTDQ